MIWMTNKFGLTGVHGSGKTFLAKKLQNRILQSGKTVYFVSEVARNCPYELGTIDAQDYIWHNQMAQEKYAMKQNVDTIICDRTVMDNLIYYRDILNHNEPSPKMWIRWAVLRNIAEKWMPTYDHVIRLPLNLEYLAKDDPIRPKSVEYARRIDKLFDQYVEPFVTNHGWK